MCFSVRIGVTVFFLLSLLEAGRSYGQAPSGKGVDQYGDSLPEGAITRLGTLRLTHLGGIRAIAISPDCNMAASGVREGNEVYLSKRKLGEVGGVEIYDGDHVTQATIRLWNTKTGELIREIQTPDAPVSFILFAPDGKMFFAGCGKFLCCFETGSGKKLWEREAIEGGRFHHDGVQADGIVLANGTLVSLHSGTLICTVKMDGGTSFHYHGQRMIRLWNAKTGESLPLPKPLDSTVRAETRVPVLVHAVAVSPDLRLAAMNPPQKKAKLRHGYGPSLPRHLHSSLAAPAGLPTCSRTCSAPASTASSIATAPVCIGALAGCNGAGHT